MQTEIRKPFEFSSEFDSKPGPGPLNNDPPTRLDPE